MEETLKCSVCGSNKIIPKVNLVERGHNHSKNNLSIEIEGDPNALFFKETTKEPIKAKVCCSCGKIDLFIEETEDLWETYQKYLTVKANNLR